MGIEKYGMDAGKIKQTKQNKRFKLTHANSIIDFAMEQYHKSGGSPFGSLETRYPAKLRHRLNTTMSNFPLKKKVEKTDEEDELDKMRHLRSYEQFINEHEVDLTAAIGLR